jgi:type II secretory pathway pseudopilin PulG
MHKKNGFSMLEMLAILTILAAFLGTITAITARLSRQHQNESLKLQAKDVHTKYPEGLQI